MAQRDGTDPGQLSVAVCFDGREPYRMFEVVALTTGDARLRGPLMLEVGEQLSLRLTRGGQTVEVEGRITAIARGDEHADPITTVELVDGAAVAPLVG